ncbi:major facilitator superfamily protein [Hirsutella rhossiliensis]|uniref:Major facilitator superfamily domain-containing protein n=1 Tax=Hirsutella rhossiliensis TaxID=111463 RepID=A0A9P8SFQ4_9HYPO|nr:major facilitator superfamily domain-containing protein [Hirsutella rhossiliensis]KAH0961173.1 major facilitator superfamily domain-containing protein [Hirsutella rhossiliensis]
MDGKAEFAELSAMRDPATASLTRSVLLKTDSRVLPVLALLFLCSFLDRTNVGNARIVGLVEDLGMTDLQFTQGLAVFYATYIFSELPSNLVLKRVSPRIWLPCLAVAWGLVTMCLGFVRGFGSFVAVRAILGVAEGGLLPGMVLYLSGLYTRGELALRIGIFYTAASLSGAFGGLLARGLSAIGPRGGLEGWRWIFIIEGLITVVAGAIAFVGLPNSPATARYLTQEEREWALKRLAANEGGRFNLASEREEGFRWSEVGRGIRNVQVWLTSTAYFAILSGLYSFGLFLPTIVNDLNIASNPNTAQLWTVIPYAVATPVTVVVAFLSDRLKLRGTLVLFVLPVAIAGYAAMANVTGASPRFAMTCLMAIGLYAAVPCILVWNSNNSAGHYKRATTSAVQLAVANCGGFVATFVYPKSDGPLYHRGHTIILGLLCYAWAAVWLNVLWCAKINRGKQRGDYDEYINCGDDRDPGFRMIL